MSAMRIGIAAACERALVRSARAQRVGSRQQVRAAARRFVRRHRRDAGYLAWVLRSVAASSALAATLLGIGVERAEAAKLPPYVSSTLLSTMNASPLANPALADLDGDGDLDAVSGRGDGAFLWFEAGGDGEPFVERTGAANPLNGHDVGSNSAPAFGDLDADGDLDLVGGTDAGTFAWLENTGSATAPAFAARTGAANPLNGHDVGSNSAPAFGDLDADGDLDLVTGALDGTFVYLENTGIAVAPAFALRSGAANPLNGIDLGASANPALGDLDGDGDLDLYAGEHSGTVLLFENTGNPIAPAFAARTGAGNPLTGIAVGGRAAPALGDLDGDGNLDVAIGNNSGAFASFASRAGWMVARTGAANPMPLLPVTSPQPSFSAMGDLDGDGDLDLIWSAADGTLLYFENTGVAASAAFVLRTGAASPVAGIDLVYAPIPALADLDADGDLDLVAGLYAGAAYFENVGTPIDPSFSLVSSGSSPFTGVYAFLPAFGDLDGDGDLDLLSGRQDGFFSYSENTGTPATAAFALRSGAANPLFGVDLDSTMSKPMLGDVDGDGDLDCVSGLANGVLWYFENTGGPSEPLLVRRTEARGPLGGGNDLGVDSAPALGDLDGDGDLDLVAGPAALVPGLFLQLGYLESFVAQQPTATPQLGAANPLAGQDVGAASTAALGDLDGDGDADLLAGEDLGTFRYFENSGSAIAPAFVARAGAANPLNGQDVGDLATPALADLDSDGDLDLLSGRLPGDFDWFENTGNARTPLFAASLANPFGLSGACSDSSAPAFADLDADGDLDLAAGCYDDLVLFENTGDPTAPAFVLRVGPLDPLRELPVGAYAVPAFADFDHDGDLDFASGSVGGHLRWFRNVGTRQVAAFTRQIEEGNPLAGADAGNRSAPAAADLDGNGYADLVTGAEDGTFTVHYMPEPAQGLLLGAGLALLGWLGRQRHRSR
jgi:hypothetical protein